MGEILVTNRRVGEGENWSYGDSRVGPDVPKIVRRGGATRPTHKRELSGNGTAYEGHPANFECEECGDVRRFVTANFMTMHWCQECDDHRWFEFQWGLNR